jgi:hypothetical protein
MLISIILKKLSASYHLKNYDFNLVLNNWIQYYYKSTVILTIKKVENSTANYSIAIMKFVILAIKYLKIKILSGKCN